MSAFSYLNPDSGGIVMKECLKETKIVAVAAVALDLLFIIVSAIFFKIDFKVFLGLIIGTIYAILNHIALWYTIKGLSGKTRVKFSYAISYTVRFAVAGICLVIGFLYLNPFAVVVPMLAPKAGYYFMAFTGKDI